MNREYDVARPDRRLAWLNAKCSKGGNCLAPYTGKRPTICVKCGGPQ